MFSILFTISNCNHFVKDGMLHPTHELSFDEKTKGLDMPTAKDYDAEGEDDG